MADRPRIAFLTSSDPRRLDAWSGTLFFMARALETHCGEVDLLGPYAPAVDVVYRARGRLRRLAGGRPTPWMHRPARSRAFARAFGKRLEGGGYDVVFAPAASTEIARLETPIPIIYTSDATYRLLEATYAEFAQRSARARAQGDAMERAAIERAARLVYPSEWAARSAVDDYGASPDVVRVFPYGANLLSPPAEPAAAPGPSSPCELLFLGRDWQRKGGDTAVAVVEALRSRGVPARLTVVGCDPPVDHPAVRSAGVLRKDHPTEGARLARLLASSHFLLLPTRAECFGIVFCEASAYGLPSVATASGGVAGAVAEGVNGFLVAPDQPAGAYADIIEALVRDPERYRALRRSARRRYEEELSWDAWGERMRGVIRDVV